MEQPTENYYKLPSMELVTAMAKGLLSGGDMIYDPSVSRNVAILAGHAYACAQAIMDKHLAELNAAGYDIDENGCHFEIAAMRSTSSEIGEPPAAEIGVPQRPFRRLTDRELAEESRESLEDPTKLYELLTEIASDDYITCEKVMAYLRQLRVLENPTGTAAKDVYPVAFNVLRNTILQLYNIADAYKELQDAPED